LYQLAVHQVVILVTFGYNISDMPIFTNIGGVWHQSPAVTGPKVNVGGVWHQVSNAYVNVSGLGWRPIWTRAFNLNYVFSATTTNQNLRTIALAAGWDGVLPLIATYTVNSGVIIGSTTTSAYALDTGTSFPNGSSLTLVNNYYIVGAGGTGGIGGNQYFGTGGAGGAGYTPGEGRWGNSGNNTGQPGGSGTAGGPAVIARVPLTIINNGVIGGGGGGGGAAGNGPNGYVYQPSGTLTTGGVAWPPNGGSGGNLGMPGTGGTIYNGSSGAGNGVGGAAGYAITGNSNISWSVSGSVLGPVA